MRVIVLFDLPVKTYENKREYRLFRRFLIKQGFLMLQESVYCKLVLNASMAAVVTTNIHKNAPGDGLVQILTVTEKQYAKMDLVIGSSNSNVLNTDERLVIL